MGVHRGSALRLLRRRAPHRRRHQKDALPSLLAALLPLRASLPHRHRRRNDRLPRRRLRPRLHLRLHPLRILLLRQAPPRRLLLRLPLHGIQHGNEPQKRLQETLRQTSPTPPRPRMAPRPQGPAQQHPRQQGHRCRRSGRRQPRKSRPHQRHEKLALRLRAPPQRPRRRAVPVPRRRPRHRRRRPRQGVRTLRVHRTGRLRGFLRRRHGRAAGAG
mmetsp:Transcript_1960/g.5229  ORF Transcript_1960/g.5229 Transcript_1960/m.5229 type:complete len:216 (-) Transcript_1960:1626-2273(-)